MHRYTIKNHTHFVQFELTGQGLRDALIFRRVTPEFKRRRISVVLQLTPSEVKPGVIHEIK